MTQNFGRCYKKWFQSSPDIGNANRDSNLGPSVFVPSDWKDFRSKFKLSKVSKFDSRSRSFDWGEAEKNFWWINLRYSCKKNLSPFPTIFAPKNCQPQKKRKTRQRRKRKKSLAIKASIRLKISQLEWKAAADRRHRRFPDFESLSIKIKKKNPWLFEFPKKVPKTFDLKFLQEVVFLQQEVNDERFEPVMLWPISLWPLFPTRQEIKELN